VKLKDKLFLGGTVSLIAGLIVKLAVSPSVVVHSGAESIESQFDQVSSLDSSQVTSQMTFHASPQIYLAESASHDANSLQGLDISFPLMVNEQDQLVINDALVELIEWYLSSLGEASIENVIAQIHQAFSQSLPETAQVQAQTFLKQYLGYKQELADVQTYLSEVQDGTSRIEQLRLKKAKLADIRAKHFAGYDYEVLFSESDQYDEFLMHHLTIAEDDMLTPEEKVARQKENEQRLPESLLAARQNSTKFSDVSFTVDELRNQGASDEDVYEYRRARLGEEAAQSLAELDTKRNAWQSRVTQFKKLNQKY
jgi:lipase chaperone LimK